MKSTQPNQVQPLSDRPDMNAVRSESAPTRTQNRHPNDALAALILVAFLLIPLVYSKWTADAVLLPKTLALQLLLLIGLPVAWLKSKEWRRETLSYGVPILYLIFTLYSLFSLAWATNPVVGFYDWLRHLTVTLFYVFVLLSLRYITQGFLLKTLVIAGTVLATIGVLQCLGWEWLTSLPGATRAPYATMANKNFYASVMLVLFPFSAVAGFLLKRWRYVSLLNSLAIFTTILLTGTRAAWVGFAIALAATAIITFFSVGKPRLSLPFKSVAGVAIIVLALVVLAGLLYGANVYLATADNHSIWSTIKSIFTFDSERRIHYWQPTLKMVKDVPVSGVGLGNWAIELPKYRDISHIRTVVRPHNDFLWILAETGGVGLAIYLLVIGFHFKYLLQALLSHGISRQRSIFLLGVFFATTAYLVNSFFTFPRERIYVSMLFAMCLALSTHTASTRRRTSTPSNSLFKRGRTFYLLPLRRGGREGSQLPPRCSSNTRSMPLYLARLTYLLTDRVILRITYALLIVCFGTTVHLTYADGYGKYASHYFWSAAKGGHTNRIKENLNEKTVYFSTKAINHWLVLDKRVQPMHWYRGSTYFKRGEIQTAKDDLEKAYQYHPNHVGVLNSQALIYRHEGRLDEAIALYHRALVRFPHTRVLKKNLNNLQKKLAMRVHPELINTQGTEIQFNGPIEKGTISIKADGGKDLGWTAIWQKKSVWLIPGSGKELDYGVSYTITIKTRDRAGNPLIRRLPIVTRSKE